MANTILRFDLALQRFAGKTVPERLAQIQQAVALEALRSVVLMTPVDMGRARANWQVAHDAPATGEVDATDKSGGATIAKGAEEAAAIRPFEQTYITNSLPYIKALEDGSSQQAPAGMVGVTVQRLKSQFGR